MENGKWVHMMDSAHTGFRNWDDNDWTYPQIRMVNPIPRGKIVVSFRGNSAYHLGAHWQDGAPLYNEEMRRPDCDKILLDIDSRGNKEYTFKVACNKPWLFVSQTVGKSCLEKEARSTLVLTCRKEKISGEETAKVRLDFEFENGDTTWSEVCVKAKGNSALERTGIFMENEGCICMDASHFTKKADVKGGSFEVIKRLGRTSDAIKSFPVTKNWEKEKNRPYVEYDFYSEEGGEYELHLYLAPTESYFSV